jgi:hypothetical protein
MKTVFVTKREVAEKAFKRVDATLSEKFGALRAYTFDHLDVGLQAVGHKDVYIISVDGTRGDQGEWKQRRKGCH